MIEFPGGDKIQSLIGKPLKSKSFRYSISILLFTYLFDHTFRNIDGMYAVAEGNKMHGVDAGAGVQFKDVTARIKIIFNMAIHLFAHIPENGIGLIIRVVIDRLLAESTVDGFFVCVDGSLQWSSDQLQIDNEIVSHS